MIEETVKLYFHVTLNSLSAKKFVIQKNFKKFCTTYHLFQKFEISKVFYSVKICTVAFYTSWDDLLIFFQHGIFFSEYSM